MKPKLSILILFAAILTSLLLGCSRTTVSQLNTPTYTGAEVVVLSQSELTEIITETREKFGVPAMAAAVVTDQGLQQVAVVGFRKWKDPAPVTLDELWPLGSDTKIMTSALASILVDQGKLRWDSTVAEMFPEMAASFHPDFKSVTLLQLLSHRAGLPHDIDYDLLDQFVSIQEQRVAAARMALSQKPTEAPGSTYQYSNIGYIIAGAMIERASGVSWEDAMEQYLFSPLGMASAGFGGMDKNGKANPLWGHSRSGPPVVCCNGPEADNLPVVGPAGMVHSTIQDWAKFIADQLRGARGEPAFLSPQAYNKLLTNYGGYYSLGWALCEGNWAGGVSYGHDGSNSLYWAKAWMAPAMNYAVLVTANAGDENAAAATEEAFEIILWRFMGSMISANPTISNLEYGFLWTCMCILVSVLVAVPILRWRIIDPAGTPKSLRRWVRAAAWIAWVNSILFTIFFYFAALNQSLEIFVKYPILLVFTLPFRTDFFLYLAYACLALTITQVIFTILAWKGKQRSQVERIYYSLATLGASGYILLLVKWGLIAVH
jgi:CubicO group peptidase (beta-lactamase class C family)